MSELQPPDPKRSFSVQHKNGHEELTHVHPSVRELTESVFGGAHLTIGEIYLWDPAGKGETNGIPVEITYGQFWGEYGVSNFWNWVELSADGTLSGKEHHGYDNVAGVFHGPISREEALRKILEKNGE